MTARLLEVATSVGVAFALVVTVPASASGDASHAPTRQVVDRPSSAALNTQVQRQQALLDDQQERLAAAQAQAAAALGACQAALRHAEQAQRQAEVEARRLVTTKAATLEARDHLAAYIGTLYRTGMVNRSMPIYLSLLSSRNPRQLFSGLGLADRIGGNQGNLMLALQEAQAAQAFAAERAEHSRVVAEAAKVQAVAAVEQANHVVAVANALVLDRQIALLRTQAAAAAALAQEQRRASLLARAELIARQRAMTPNPAVDGASVPRPHASCKGKPTQGYQNGRIPSDALCPLWGTRGQMLRADAAAAFNDMSRAYAREFGLPLCVTDSYRSYEEQEAVAREKPELAAKPGTSNHGWGLATDLCDGVQSFGTATHRWMQDNSMMFAWFLPTWAQQSGSKPEPWHWEFAG